MVIVPELSKHVAAVRQVHAAAFETEAEAELVDCLRAHANPLVSMVALVKDAVVGHILFSKVTLKDHPRLNWMGLAPLGVVPTYQRQGIGSALVRAGLEHCRQIDVEAICVLGDPAFYGRFEFEPSVRYGVRSQYDVPDDVFQVVALQSPPLSKVCGVVAYHEAFGQL